MPLSGHPRESIGRIVTRRIRTISGSLWGSYPGYFSRSSVLFHLRVSYPRANLLVNAFFIALLFYCFALHFDREIRYTLAGVTQPS